MDDDNQQAVENLEEESLVAQRIVHDAITTAGGVCQMPVTKSMLLYAQGARQRYTAYLEAEKEEVLKQNLSKTSTRSESMSVRKQKKWRPRRGGSTRTYQHC